MRKTEPKVSLLIISQDVIDRHLAGPGLRYSEMAKALSTDLAITLAAPQGSDPAIESVNFLTYAVDRLPLEQAAKSADVILLSGSMLYQFPFLLKTTALLVIDMYDPMLLENLYYTDCSDPLNQTKRNIADIDTLNALAQTGDFYICASERQRDFWLGVLAANGRINPYTFSNDRTFRNLIDVVGMGVVSEDPLGAPYLKGKHPQVPADAKIVLWGGGIWNWLDPLTLINAWVDVVKREPKARLIFLGSKHPNPAVPQHEMAHKALELAKTTGLLDQSILFFEWLSIDEREALLAETDIGIVCHPESLETHFALRTRVLDYFWAQLPIVTTEGDVMSETVKQYKLGWVVDAENQSALSDALISALKADRNDMKQNYLALQELYTWENQLSPLRDYCLKGNFAPDRLRRSIPAHLKFSFRLKRKLSNAALRLKSRVIK